MFLNRRRVLYKIRSRYKSIFLSKVHKIGGTKTSAVLSYLKLLARVIYSKSYHASILNVLTDGILGCKK